MKTIARFVAVLAMAWVGTANALPITYDFTITYEANYFAVTTFDAGSPVALGSDDIVVENLNRTLDPSGMDIYEFETLFCPNACFYDIELRLFSIPLGVDLDLYAYNEAGVLIATSLNGGNVGEFISLGLADYELGELYSAKIQLFSDRRVHPDPTGMSLPPTLALFALGLLAMRRRISA